METNTEKAIKWIQTAVIAMLGGGLAAGFAAATDPSKYSFPHDFGSGKLWKYVFMGWGLTLGGLLIKSPLGQKVMGSYKQIQTQLQQSQAELAQAKEDLKACATPPPKSEDSDAGKTGTKT